jgi:hypothetical protein
MAAMITRPARPPTTLPAMVPASGEVAGAGVEREVVGDDDDDDDIAGLTLLKVVEEVVSTKVEDVVDDTVEDVVDDTVEDDVKGGPAPIVIAPGCPQHAVFPPPQHQVVELLAPEQEVTCAFPFASYNVPRTN